MDATLYTGNGYPTAGTQSIVNSDLGSGGFKPDFIWIKQTNGVGNHTLTDSVRGTNSQLFSAQTVAQETVTDAVTAFNTNGFSLGSNTQGTLPFVNTNNQSFVAWQWQAGQGTTSSNTAGSQTSTVSVNATAGFSIVTFTATGVNVNGTVGHGLGATPSLIIVKNSASASNWVVYSSAVVTNVNQFLRLNDTSALITLSQVWGSTLPTSTVFGIRGDVTVAASTACVAYCWTPIAGFSQFGSYTGNGSSDGPFVYTGFRPAFMLTKRTDTTSDWVIIDTSRAPYNAVSPYIVVNTNAAENNYTGWDLLSNGIKLRNTDAGINANGGTYIYMAFAENPFKYANAR
jgi:hypothetical protein